MLMTSFPLFPEQASTSAARVDNLYFFLLAVSAFFSFLICGLLLFMAYKYRHRMGSVRTGPPKATLKLELVWTIVPFLIAMVMFVWGASVFFHLSRPPDDTMDILVVGKQWMWKLQHPNGRREINELHVPVGRAVKLVMTSEDVIHSFYVPAFRIKADVVPGRYTSAWFRPTKPGKYHLFCAEYCGTEHSGMGGWVHVMEPAEFQAWLGGGAPGVVTPVSAGESLFGSLGCANCHANEASPLGPSLVGLYGRTVSLADGRTLVADEAYLRESIVNPGAKLVTGYPAVMPTFRGLVGEEGLMQIIEYIKSTDGGDPPSEEGSPGTDTLGEQGRTEDTPS